MEEVNNTKDEQKDKETRVKKANESYKLSESSDKSDELSESSRSDHLLILTV